jgi:nicotinamide N-methyltransferase
MVDLVSIPFAGRTILELGSGAGLPSLLASTASEPPHSVLLTDYPDSSITDNLAANVARNLPAATPGCKVAWRGFEWGADVEPLLSVEPHSPRVHCARIR